MDLKELNNMIEDIDLNMSRAGRGDDTLFMLGRLVAGVWEVARQIAMLKEGK